MTSQLYFPFSLVRVNQHEYMYLEVLSDWKQQVLSFFLSLKNKYFYIY